MVRLFVSGVVVLSLLYALWSVSLYRIANYGCLKGAWLSLIPVMNLLFFCWVADVFAEYMHEESPRITRWLFASVSVLFVVSMVIHMMVPYETALMVSSILLQISAVTLVLILSWNYVLFIGMTFEHMLLVSALSIFCLQPIVMFLVSLRLPSKAEEVAEIFSGQ